MTINIKELAEAIAFFDGYDYENAYDLHLLRNAARAYLDMAKSSRRALHPSQLTDDEADLIAKSKMPDPADRSQNTEY